MISEVYFKELDPEVCDPEETAEFYYYYNLLGLADVFDQGYENHERRQLEIRNNIIRDAIQSGDMPAHPKINTAIFGLSSLKDTSIVVVEI